MNGRAHATASIVASVPVGLAMGLALGPDVGLCAAGGCLAGIFVNPDLDQLTIERAEWKIIKWLPMIGWGWMMLWDVYARVCRHRGFLSHFPIIGTIGRVLYLEAVDCVWWLLRGLPEPTMVTPTQVKYAFGVFIGLMASDCLHWIMDGCPVQVAKWGKALLPRFA